MNLILTNLGLSVIFVFFIISTVSFLKNNFTDNELYLVYFAVIFAYLYRLIRAISSDSFIWILIFPTIIIVYLFYLSLSRRIHKKDLDIIDYLFFFLFLYGIFSTILSYLVTGQIIGSLAKFSHFYFPLVLYFIVRIHLTKEPKNYYKIFNLFWIISVLLIINFIAEYYLIMIIEKPGSIYWSYPFMEQFASNYSSDVSARIETDSKAFLLNLGIFGYLKVLVMSIASLSFFYMSAFYSQKKYYNKNQLKVIYLRSTILNITLFLVALICILFSRYTTVIGVSFIVIILTNLYFFNSKIIIPAVLILACIFLIFQELIIVQFEIKFLTQYSEGKTAFQTIFNLYPLVQDYKSNFYNSILGDYIHSTSMIRGGQETELRILAYPIFYGWIWAILFLLLIFNLIKKSNELIKFERFNKTNLLGLGFMGYFLFIILDFHYPYFDRHGPFETFVVLSALLVSINKNNLKSNEL